MITQILLTAGIVWSFAGAFFTKETSDNLDSYSPLGKFILLFLGGPAVWFLTVSLLPWIAFTFYKQRRYRKQVKSDLEQFRAFVEKLRNQQLPR